MTAIIAPPTEFIRRLAGLEQIGDVLLRIVAELLLGDVGDPALAFEIRPAGKALRRMMPPSASRGL